MKFVDASMGFKAPLWQVVNLTTGETRYTLALDNYTACEAHNWRFSQCRVSEVQGGSHVSN